MSNLITIHFYFVGLESAFSKRPAKCQTPPPHPPPPPPPPPTHPPWTILQYTLSAPSIQKGIACAKSLIKIGPFLKPQTPPMVCTRTRSPRAIAVIKGYGTSLSNPLRNSTCSHGRKTRQNLPTLWQTICRGNQTHFPQKDLRIFLKYIRNCSQRTFGMTLQ